MEGDPRTHKQRARSTSTGTDGSADSASGEDDGFDDTAVADPYKVLGLAPGCTSAEVRRAFRSLSLKLHPDKVHSTHQVGAGSAERGSDVAPKDRLQRWQEVKDAKARLLDPLRRALYDAHAGDTESRPTTSHRGAQRRPGEDKLPLEAVSDALRSERLAAFLGKCRDISEALPKWHAALGLPAGSLRLVPRVSCAGRLCARIVCPVAYGDVRHGYVFLCLEHRCVHVCDADCGGAAAEAVSEAAMAEFRAGKAGKGATASAGASGRSAASAARVARRLEGRRARTAALGWYGDSDAKRCPIRALWLAKSWVFDQQRQWLCVKRRTPSAGDSGTGRSPAPGTVAVDGKPPTYWFNTQTGASVWERPAVTLIDPMRLSATWAADPNDEPAPEVCSLETCGTTNGARAGGGAFKWLEDGVWVCQRHGTVHVCSLLQCDCRVEAAAEQRCWASGVSFGAPVDRKVGSASRIREIAWTNSDGHEQRSVMEVPTGLPLGSSTKWLLEYRRSSTHRSDGAAAATAINGEDGGDGDAEGDVMLQHEADDGIAPLTGAAPEVGAAAQDKEPGNAAVKRGRESGDAASPKPAWASDPLPPPLLLRRTSSFEQEALVTSIGLRPSALGTPIADDLIAERGRRRKSPVQGGGSNLKRLAAKLEQQREELAEFEVFVRVRGRGVHPVPVRHSTTALDLLYRLSELLRVVYAFQGFSSSVEAEGTVIQIPPELTELYLGGPEGRRIISRRGDAAADDDAVADGAVGAGGVPAVGENATMAALGARSGTWFYAVPPAGERDAVSLLAASACSPRSACDDARRNRLPYTRARDLVLRLQSPQPRSTRPRTLLRATSSASPDLLACSWKMQAVSHRRNDHGAYPSFVRGRIAPVA